MQHVASLVSAPHSVHAILQQARACRLQLFFSVFSSHLFCFSSFVFLSRALSNSPPSQFLTQNLEFPRPYFLVLLTGGLWGSRSLCASVHNEDKSSGEAGHGYSAPAVTRHYAVTHAGSLLPQTLVGTLTSRCRETDKGWYFPPSCHTTNSRTSLPRTPVFDCHRCPYFATMDACIPLLQMPILCYHGCPCSATSDARTLLPRMPIFCYLGCPYSATWMPANLAEGGNSTNSA